MRSENPKAEVEEKKARLGKTMEKNILPPNIENATWPKVGQ